MLHVDAQSTRLCAASRVHHRSCTTPMRRRHAARHGCHGQRPTGATCPAGLCGSKPWQQPARMQQRAFGSLTGHVAARREAPSERCRSSRRSRPPRGPSTSGLRMLPAKPTLPAATAIKLRSCSGQAHTRRPFREDCHHAWSVQRGASHCEKRHSTARTASHSAPPRRQHAQPGLGRAAHRLERSSWRRQGRNC